MIKILILSLLYTSFDEIEKSSSDEKTLASEIVALMLNDTAVDEQLQTLLLKSMKMYCFSD